MASAEEIVRFWRDAGPKAWFKKDDAFDAELRTRFEGAHREAARGVLSAWEQSADGALALVLLTDQIPRNIHRNSAFAFATDEIARNVAQRAVARGFDAAIDPALRLFFYLPFEHAENPALQEMAVTLFENIGDAEYTKFAKVHCDIIARFGRFPHRNAVLGRESTAEEIAFLEGGGFKG